MYGITFFNYYTLNQYLTFVTCFNNNSLVPPVTSLAYTQSYCLEESLGILLQTAIYLFIKMIPVLII